MLVVSAPAPPERISEAEMRFTLPPMAGARVPTLMISLASPALTVVMPEMVRMLIVSMPPLALRVVAPV